MLLDNRSRGSVGIELKKRSFKGSKLAVFSSLFTIYGYESLRSELGKLSEGRLLLTNWQNQTPQSLIGSEDEVRLINQLNQRRIARDCAKWIRGKVKVKAGREPNQSVPNLIHLTSQSGTFTVHGSAALTPTGLGEVLSDAPQMNMVSTDTQNTREQLEWFNAVWSDESGTVDIRKELLERLDFIAAEQPARFVYLLTLYNIFQDTLTETGEQSIIRGRTGFKDTRVWNKLYKFQKDGVLGAVDKLEKHNGCIIADSVGLGKTFEALAIIKYYELRNHRVLVLCPKKLRENWTAYTLNDKRNPLVDDRFNYDVLNHTDLSRTKGFSGAVNLETLNWSNYDLIVIDESHNFRNIPSRANGKTRYERLLDDIIRSGVRSKVLMLSATPVNSRMSDLKNQAAFITEGRDDAFNHVGIRSIDLTLRMAQKQFNQWLKQPVESRTTDALLDRMSFDYFKLLDVITIARSRKHIEKYYGTADIGEFPTRLPPKNIYADIDLSGDFPPLSEVNETIQGLSLAGYSPLKFVRPDKKDEYEQHYDMSVRDGAGIFKQIDREESLVHLMRVNLLKRMESSIRSFRITVDRLNEQIGILLSKIEEHESDSGNYRAEALSIEDIDDFELDSPELEPFIIGRKTKVLLQDMDLIRFRQELKSDRLLLTHIAHAAARVSAERDAKLHQLKNTITQKVKNPFNENNRKVIVFTAFADTAQYLYTHLAQWAKKELNIESALITGGSMNKTAVTGIRSELSSILTAFSPISKERDKIEPNTAVEIDLLIATDCISEGQNLQDCDTLINYDIHWNPVRIIQRFGRVDRLGSRNRQIQLINFWPNMELDEYINLEARVSGRMILLDISATGQGNLIDTKQINDLEYRRKQLRQLKNAVVDLEDMAGGVSITDLTLNDFRMDLSDYMERSRPDLSALQQAPIGLYAAVTFDKTLAEDALEPGVIFCLKNIRTGVQAVPVSDNYPLASYFLVYVSDNGVIELNFTQGKKVLDLFKRQAFSHSSIDPRAADRVNRSMKHYQHLLAAAVDSITVKSREKGVESLFSRGGTVLTAAGSQSIEDFAVVSYLILVPEAPG